LAGCQQVTEGRRARRNPSDGGNGHLEPIEHLDFLGSRHNPASIPVVAGDA
jgi:hypothetical protein